MPDALLDNLNAPQREAVTYVNGPSLVVAGAGAGKTRVLTHKVAYLIRLGLEPYRILALTFTNKAANEMRSRIDTLMGPEASRGLWMGTFHSVFARILRSEAESVGCTSQFTIYQPSDCKSLVKTILREQSLDDKVYKPSLLLSRISRAKNDLITAASYAESDVLMKRDERDMVPRLSEIYRFYDERLRQANAMDFDDLLLRTYLLFESHPEICNKWADRFRFVLVDEYQDTNYVQHQILRQLCGKSRMICAVGDDAQSIYGFRGAKIDNILGFSNTYEGTQLFKLERNYRSTKTIVNAAGSLIAHNAHQIPKAIYSENATGDPILLTSTYSDREEGEWVCGRIARLTGRDHVDPAQIAILYRTNAQSRIFEEILRRYGIAYRIYGGNSFYDRKEIRDALAYFRLIVNPNDEEAFRRIVNYPARKLGETTIARVLQTAGQHGMSAMQLLRTAPEQLCTVVNRPTLTRLLEFRQMIDNLTACLETTDAYTLASRVLTDSTLMAEAARQAATEGKEMQQNLSELLNGIKTFVDDRSEVDSHPHVLLPDYLSEVSLISEDESNADDNQSCVSLMTVHAAKGLEFDEVFIVGLERDLFPAAKASTSTRELEEERRLFYVALTRAGQHCYLSCAKMRYHYGHMDFTSPSPFLKEIDQKYLRIVGMQADKPVTPRPQERPVMPTRIPETPAGTRRNLVPIQKTQPTPTARPASEARTTTGERLIPGTKVHHERFGAGVVVSLEGSGGEAKAVVDFAEAGRKTLLLKFARITVV